MSDVYVIKGDLQLSHTLKIKILEKKGYEIKELIKTDDECTLLVKSPFGDDYEETFKLDELTHVSDIMVPYHRHVLFSKCVGRIFEKEQSKH
jgi:hypothetical protein